MLTKDDGEKFMFSYLKPIKGGIVAFGGMGKGKITGIGKIGDVAPSRACMPWILFINGVLCFLKINGSGMEEKR